MFFVDNFNSHAHVERDDLVKNLKERYPISTHTLTWSVTTADLKISADVFISTHTLTWSVTCRFFLCRLFICHFNSHAHVERDSLITFSYFNQFAFQLTRSRGA